MNAVVKPNPAVLIAAGRRTLEIEGGAFAALSPRLETLFARSCTPAPGKSDVATVLAAEAANLMEKHRQLRAGVL